MYRLNSLVEILKIKVPIKPNRNCYSSTPSNEPLYDNYGRGHDYLRISLTERCNLRCKYCMPEEGIRLADREDCLDLAELERISSIFVKKCGIKKVRLTGGEPTMDKRLFQFLKHLGELRQDGLKTIAITTNGLTLKRQSSTFKDLGLNAINVSLDTLNEEKFERLTRRKGWNLVYQGLMSAIETKFDAVKVNCVLMKGINDDEILEFAKLAQKYPIEVRFIEFMPFAGNGWSSDKMLENDEALKILQKQYSDLERLSPVSNEISKVYKSQSMFGTIGFISSMSRNFCSECNRLRLTSDGQLKVCLFGQQETSLRDLMRNGASDDEIVKAVSASLGHKKKQHSGMFKLQHETSRPMIKIGARAYHDFRPGTEEFSHLDAGGRACMVDVGSKSSVKRTAVAQGKIMVGADVLSRICDQSMPKGDIMSVSRVAGIMGAKCTSQLIPMCHQIPLSHISIDIVADKADNSLVVVASVSATHNTGVEMESLTAVSVTLLTIYDMCKSVNKEMVITEIKLLSKIKR